MSERKSPGKPRKYERALKSRSFRLSTKHQYAIRLLARAGRIATDAEILEEMIEKAADGLAISRSWRTLWDEDEATRTLNLYTLPEYRPKEKSERSKRHEVPAESQLRQFCLEHEQFFWSDRSRKVVNRNFCAVLWPQVEELAALWWKHRADDYYIAAKEMAAMLKKKGRKPPAFG